MTNLDKYHVNPKKFLLKNYKTDDKSERTNSKEQDSYELTKLAIEINALQDILHAEGKRKVLLLLQGMDTSGKDGTVRHVFSECDPFGIRPLCMGKTVKAGVISTMFASESVALEGTTHAFVRNLEPGEAVFVDLNGNLHAQQCAAKPVLNPCIFEFVYLARPDSVMDGISVYQARLNLGETLAKRVVSTVPPSDIDVVIPIPESSRPSAAQLAHLLGLPYREGFVKNRYVGRTFIMPGQAVRKQSVRQKLNAISSEFKGRNVLLVDDSIVRGTTCKEIVQMARDAGANKVYMASAAPPVRFPNVYGIDMPTKDELVAHNRTVEQIREIIGCDALIYQDVDAMKSAILKLAPKAGAGNVQLAGFDASCFDGVYVTGDITDGVLTRMRDSRTASAQKTEDQEDNSRLALPNPI